MVQHLLNNKIIAVTLVLSLVGVAGYATKALTAGPSFCENLEQSLDAEDTILNEDAEDLLEAFLVKEEKLFERSAYNLESILEKLHAADIVRETNTDVWIQKALEAGAQEAIDEFNVAIFEAIQERDATLEIRVAEYESTVQQLVEFRVQTVESYYNDYYVKLQEIYDTARIGCDWQVPEKELASSLRMSMKELKAEFSDRKSEYEINTELKEELAAKKESILDVQKAYAKLYDSIKETLKRLV